MKKLLMSLIVFVGFVGIACADNYTVTLTSFVKTTDATTFNADAPNIAGGVIIDKIQFCSTNTITTPLLIGVYDLATTTYTATLDAYWVLTGSNTYLPAGQSLTIDYPYYNPLKLTNPYFFKADGDTSHAVQMNLQYR